MEKGNATTATFWNVALILVLYLYDYELNSIIPWLELVESVKSWWWTVIRRCQALIDIRSDM